VINVELVGSEFDTRVDLIVTPTRTIAVPAQHGHKPGRVVWERLEAGMLERIPSLQELRLAQESHN